MIWLTYNLLFPIGILLLLPKFLLRMKRRGGYRTDFLHRFGRYEQELQQELAVGGCVWIQAVSVGEIFVAFRLMDEIRATCPEVRFVLSTNTSTGYRIGQGRIQKPDSLIYFPLDFPWIMKRVLRLMRPRLVMLIENEMWPNMIRYARQDCIPVVLVNGRISAHSFEGYRKLRLFTRRLLPMINRFYTQSVEDGDRLLALGAPVGTVQVMGSAKYDVVRRDVKGELQAENVLETIGFAGRLLLLGGSTWEGEEQLLLELYRQLREEIPKLALMLAPRHVERKADVLRVIAEAGMTCGCRSELADGSERLNADVLLLDTTGELKNYYAHADVIFIGKSLTQHGGQNPIEPACFGKAVVVGPNMENFPSVMDDFSAAEALCQVPNPEELQRQVRYLLLNEAVRNELGARAGALVEQKSGALTQTVADVMRQSWLNEKSIRKVGLQ